MFVQYGEWKIKADILKTRSYYSTFAKGTDRFSRNFQKYCNKLSKEERAFFDFFGIDPTCAYVQSLGMSHKGTVPTSGYYYIFGEYAGAPYQPAISVETLMKQGFGTRKDNSLKIGSFCFEFQFPTDPHSDIPHNIPENCICLRFFCEDVEWLLSEKCEKRYKQVSRFERFFAKISAKMAFPKSKKDESQAYETGVFLAATSF